MDVVEEIGGLIREPIITICELSDYARGLGEKDKRQYVEKLVKCEIDCPFFIPQQMWVVEAVVIEKLCPSFTEHDIYVYLIAQRSNDTGHQLRAFKTMEEANAMVEHGWVTKLSASKIRTGSVIFKARVKHSMNFNSQPDLNTWGGLSKDGTIMACHCTCTAGLGGVCSHVGGLPYSVLNLIRTPCTSKENRWICSRKNIPADVQVLLLKRKRKIFINSEDERRRQECLK